LFDDLGNGNCVILELIGPLGIQISDQDSKNRKKECHNQVKNHIDLFIFHVPPLAAKMQQLLFINDYLRL
jgi:hypothetical protein